MYNPIDDAVVISSEESGEIYNTPVSSPLSQTDVKPNVVSLQVLNVSDVSLSSWPREHDGNSELSYVSSQDLPPNSVEIISTDSEETITAENQTVIDLTKLAIDQSNEDIIEKENMKIAAVSTATVAKSTSTAEPSEITDGGEFDSNQPTPDDMDLSVCTETYVFFFSIVWLTLLCV